MIASCVLCMYTYLAFRWCRCNALGSCSESVLDDVTGVELNVVSIDG